MRSVVTRAAGMRLTSLPRSMKLLSSRSCSSSTPPAALFSTTWPFPDYPNVLSRLALEPATTTCVRLEGDVESLVCKFVAEQPSTNSFVLRTDAGEARVRSMMRSLAATGASSFGIVSTGSSASREEDKSKLEWELGDGVFQIDWESDTFALVRQRVGAPVGTSYQTQVHCHTFLLAAGCQREAIDSFCRMLVDGDRPAPKTYPTFSIFRMGKRPGSDWEWEQEGEARARSLQSVVLPRATRKRLLDDLDDFVAAKDWYTGHGVPYKRSFLFYGPPGSGKTSLLQALAAHYNRPLYFLSPVTELNDAELRDLIKGVAKNGLLVLEDIDALFDQERKKTEMLSRVTFSGLLNALDGVGESDGKITVMTTNYREHLDAALIRPGRVDVHVSFQFANSEQMKAMFLNFYPGAPAELASRFVARLHEKLGGSTMPVPSPDGEDDGGAEVLFFGGKGCSTSLLQNYFVLQRKNDATQAVDNLDVLVDLLDDLNKATPDD